MKSWVFPVTGVTRKKEWSNISGKDGLCKHALVPFLSTSDILMRCLGLRLVIHGMIFVLSIQWLMSGSAILRRNLKLS